MDIVKEDEAILVEGVKVNIKVSPNTESLIRYCLKMRRFKKLESIVRGNINKDTIQSLITYKGDTQKIERIYIDIIKRCLNYLKYHYEEAGSQQSKDFRNLCRIGLNIEVKKTDSTTVFFNDTLPSPDIFYIIIFTGKKYKRKTDIQPKIIFINGYELCKRDLYLLLDYKKDIEWMKDKWGRKGKSGNAEKFVYFSVYPRPNYKINIVHLLDSEYSYNLE